MRNLRKSLITAAGLILILAGGTFISRNREKETFEEISMGINKVIETPVEIEYTLEEQEDIKYFRERATLVWSSFVLDKPLKIRNSVHEMIEKYPNMNSRIQEVVKEDMEDGLFFLNGAYKIYKNSEGFAPY